jgi:hypothetical protein
LNGRCAEGVHIAALPASKTDPLVCARGAGASISMKIANAGVAALV